MLSNSLCFVCLSVKCVVVFEASKPCCIHSEHAQWRHHWPHRKACRRPTRKVAARREGTNYSDNKKRISTSFHYTLVIIDVKKFQGQTQDPSSRGSLNGRSLKRLKTISPCYTLWLVEDNFKFCYLLLRNKVFLEVLFEGISASRVKRK